MARFLAIAVIVSTCVCAAQAAVQDKDVLSGTWEGETRGGASLVLTLAVKGTALTGTLVRDGQSAALSDGKVTKNTFTFKAALNERLEEFSGEGAGDEIKIWLDRQGASTAIVLRRVKRH
jgi:hypothetical protein